MIDWITDHYLITAFLLYMTVFAMTASIMGWVLVCYLVMEAWG